MSALLIPQDSIAKWCQMTRKERDVAQEHLIDLCRILGHPISGEADPSGASYTDESGASQQHSGCGWTDVWKDGRFAWDYKSKHAHLNKAYAQLLQYRVSLENPPLLVVSDIDSVNGGIH